MADQQFDIGQLSQCFEDAERNTKRNARVAAFQTRQCLPMYATGRFEFDKRTLLQFARGADSLTQTAQCLQDSG